MGLQIHRHPLAEIQVSRNSSCRCWTTRSSLGHLKMSLTVLGNCSLRCYAKWGLPGAIQKAASNTAVTGFEASAGHPWGVSRSANPCNRASWRFAWQAQAVLANESPAWWSVVGLDWVSSLVEVVLRVSQGCCIYTYVMCRIIGDNYLFADPSRTINFMRWAVMVSGLFAPTTSQMVLLYLLSAYHAQLPLRRGRRHVWILSRDHHHHHQQIQGHPQFAAWQNVCVGGWLELEWVATGMPSFCTHTRRYNVCNEYDYVYIYEYKYIYICIYIYILKDTYYTFAWLGWLRWRVAQKKRVSAGPAVSALWRLM